MSRGIAFSTTIPPEWTANNWIIVGLSAIGLGFCIAAIHVRFRDKTRRFLLKKSERPEGTYVVPHSPILCAICIAIYSAVTMADAVLLHRYWLVGSHKHSVRTLAPILPLPLWAWVWMSCFSPIYAVHLFPQQIVSEVTSPFIAKWVRFRPRTVNFACYGVPLVVGTLQITLGCVWPVIFSHGLADASMDIIQHAFVLYRTIWACWAFIFSVTSTLYLVYSIVLIKILGTQLSELNGIEAAQRRLSVPDASEKGVMPKSRGSELNSSVAGVHQLTTNAKLTQPSPILEAAGAAPGVVDSQEQTSSNTWRRRASAWLHAHHNSDSQQSRTLHKELGKYSRLELLRLNTRLIRAEAAVFSVFLYVYCAFILYRVVQGIQVVQHPRPVAIVVLLQLYIGTSFALLSAILLYWRGRNTAQTRMNMTPILRENNNPFQALAQKLQTPRLAFLYNTPEPPTQEKLPGMQVQVELQRDEGMPKGGVSVLDDDAEHQQEYNEVHSPSPVSPQQTTAQRAAAPEKASPQPSMDSAKSEEVGKSDWVSPMEWHDPPARQDSQLSKSPKTQSSRKQSIIGLGVLRR